MTEEELVELGIRSEALLNSKTFKFVVDFLANSYANNLLQSAPDQTEAREEIYRHHRALNTIVAQLAAFVQAKDQIVARQVQQDEEEDE